MAAEQNKQRVLIICAGLQMGGAERVAANMCLYAPVDEFEFHYLVFDGYDNFYGPEIEAKGGTIHTIASPSKGYRAYTKALGNLIDQLGIDVVHSHTMFNSGINLAVARKHGVPIRIAHSHTTRTETPVSKVQKIYERCMQRAIRRDATSCLSCGCQAGEWLFGTAYFGKHGEVIPNGIDTAAYAWNTAKRVQIREAFGIGKDAFVVGHSGTLLRLKNQEFLIRLLPDILKIHPGAHLVLLGEDSEDMLEKLESVAKEFGVAGCVHFCGGVSNVGDYLSAFDVFAFPSLREGTPLALLEAQCNGLPCIVSEHVPSDAFFSDLIRVCSLDDKQAWAEAICSAERHNPAVYAQVAQDAGFDAATSLGRVYKIYRGASDKKAVICLSFDDARGDNTAVFKGLLASCNLPATLNVTTGYVDGSCPVELCPSSKQAMGIEDVCQVANNPLFEIALHGDQHLNTIEDMKACEQKLRSWGVQPSASAGGCFGFASPGSGLSIEDFKAVVSKDSSVQLAYMRTSLRINTHERTRVLCRKAGRVLHWPIFYKVAYADTIMRYRDGKVIYSVPVLKDITAKQVKAVVDVCIKRRGALVLMFHSILDDVSAEDNWTWATSKFIELCDYLVVLREQGVLEVATTADMYRGLK